MPDRVDPRVFVSATTADLGTCRAAVKEAILKLGCVPVEQADFPPEASSVREMLRKRIGECDAVVHIAGAVFGSEPRQRDAGEPRRSYSQLEYDIARELGKKVYVFVCGEGFPYDDHEPEDDERRELQQRHRDDLTTTDYFVRRVASRDELRSQVLTLRTKIEELSKALGRARSFARRGVAIGLAMAAVTLGGVWLLWGRTTTNEARIAKVETELDRQRTYIKSVADAYTQVKSQLAEATLPPEVLFDRAVESVAKREGIAASELRSMIDLFVAATRANPAADFMDRALADFAERRFSAAADNAGKAAVEAKARRVAAERLASDARTEALQAGEEERDAWLLTSLAAHEEAAGHEGSARSALLNEAVSSLRAALDAVPRSASPVPWAHIQSDLGYTLLDLALASEGDVRNRCLSDAVAACRSALEIVTRKSDPDGWARANTNLGNALRSQARATQIPERKRLLEESVAAQRAALEVFAGDPTSPEWAMAQSNLANSLRDLALMVEGADRSRLLAESVAACRKSLQVYRRDEQPLDWARPQTNLAAALMEQGLNATGAERTALLTDSVTAFRSVLEVYSPTLQPFDWARTQTSLGRAIHQLAVASPPVERPRLLAQAVAAYREALAVRSGDMPVTRAATHYQLALALADSARIAQGAERVRLLDETISAIRLAIEGFPRDEKPNDWATAHGLLGLQLWFAAMERDGSQRASLLAEAAAAHRSALEVWTPSASPKEWAMSHFYLAVALCDESDYSDQPLRLRLLDESLSSCRQVLEVLVPATYPLDWARTQDLIASDCQLMAELLPEPERTSRLKQAVEALRSMLVVLTEEAAPDEHVNVLRRIEEVEAEIARSAAPAG